MAVILFFGFILIVIIVGLIYVGLAINHHRKLAKLKKGLSPSKK